jgi:hypothetical protein
MSRRSGSGFRKASARDLGVLALGVVLVMLGVGWSTCVSAGDARGTSPAVDGEPPTSFASAPPPPARTGGDLG